MITLFSSVFRRKIKMKAFKLFAFVMLALFVFTGSVAADVIYPSSPVSNGTTPAGVSSQFVTVDSVHVNGQVVNDFSPIYLEREQEVVVEVFFTGNPYGTCRSGNSNPCYTTRAEASIEGYEHGDVRDAEGPFEVEPGVQYRKVLRFTLPEDMPASDDLMLNVQIADDDNLVLARYPVRIQEVRHNLNVFDTIFNPATSVQAGQPLFATVRVENLGDNVESSIKVTVAMPALGIQTSEYVDKLVTLQNENDNQNSNADDAATTNDLMLMIPQNAQEGDYSAIVMLEYNRGRSVKQKTYTIHVAGAAAQTPQTQAAQAQASTVVSVGNEALRVNSGEGGVYKFSVANLGQQATSYTFEVLGSSDWSTSRVDPSTLVVQPNGSSDAYVYVAPHEGVTGIKTFNVKVMSGNTLVADKNLSLEVVEAQKGSDIKTVLTWIFVVLLIILVVLAIVVLVRKFAFKSEEKGVEGQTYY